MNIGDKIYLVTLLIIYFFNYLKLNYLSYRDAEADFLMLIFLLLEILRTNIIYVFINYYFYKMNFTDSVIFGSVIMLLMLLAALSEYYDIRKEKNHIKRLKGKNDKSYKRRLPYQK